MSYYLHELPGRVRIKIPTLKRNPQEATRLQNFLEEIAGIESASINTVTGSVLIKFDEIAINPHEIMHLLTHEGFIDLAKLITSRQDFEDGFSRAGAVASRALLGLVIGKAVEGTPLTLLTALI
jgi:hypothetical protein